MDFKLIFLLVLCLFGYFLTVKGMSDKYLSAVYYFIASQTSIQAHTEVLELLWKEMVVVALRALLSRPTSLLWMSQSYH